MRVVVGRSLWWRWREWAAGSRSSLIPGGARDEVIRPPPRSLSSASSSPFSRSPFPVPRAPCRLSFPSTYVSSDSDRRRRGQHPADAGGAASCRRFHRGRGGERPRGVADRGTGRGGGDVSLLFCDNWTG